MRVVLTGDLIQISGDVSSMSEGTVTVSIRVDADAVERLAALSGDPSLVVTDTKIEFGVKVNQRPRKGDQGGGDAEHDDSVWRDFLDGPEFDWPE